MKDSHVAILLEDILDQISAFAESMADIPSQVRQLTEDVGELKADTKVVKAVVTDQSKELHDHETRITQLETA